MATTSAELKQKLQNELEKAKQRLENVKQDVASLHEEDQQAIRAKQAEIKARIDSSKERAQEVQDQASAWLKERQQQTTQAVAGWRQKREIKHLERRADRAEEYAVNAVVMAMYDADAAEAAVLDALDARLDLAAAVSAPA